MATSIRSNSRPAAQPQAERGPSRSEAVNGASRVRADVALTFDDVLLSPRHSLTHPKFQAYAQTFRAKGDNTRYNTLIEGMNDFFTENVRKTVKIDDALRKKVEGPYYDSKAPVPTVNPGIYPSIAQAEQVVAIAGIRNAEAAYLQGRVEQIGGK